MARSVVLLLSGGIGTRLGGNIPKQYMEVNGRMVIDYCMERLLSCNYVAGLWIVAAEDWRFQITDACRNKDAILGFSEPGSSRTGSIINGLRDMTVCTEPDDFVIVHDAARPMVSRNLLDRCIRACTDCDGVMPVLPMKDTVYYATADGTQVESLLDRDRVFAGQAPEVFKYGKYKDALLELSPAEILKVRGSSEPAIRAGLDIRMVTGEESNYKITTPADLDRFWMEEGRR